MKVSAAPVTLFEDYVAQTEAVDTVEIRSRVTGVLERQAFEDGSRVKAGDLLFIIDRQPYLAALAQAKAALAQVQATHVNSQQSLKRVRPLLDDQAISQQDVDTAVAREAADAANMEAGRAQVKTAELNLDYTTIRAPRGGIISKALIKPGGLVNASTTLLTTLYSVDPMYVNFTISEQRLIELQHQLKRNPGDDKSKAPLFRMRLVDGSEYKLPGRLSFFDAAVDPKTGTLQARLTVPNPEGSLKPGQFLRVIVPALNLQAIRVPQKAVQELQGKRSVFVVGADNKVEVRDIVANRRVENDWVVEGGLNAGETIVVEGINKVRPGAPVKAVLAAAEGTAVPGAPAPATGSPPKPQEPGKKGS